MLPESKIEEARRLLAAGKLSQRRIAQAIGISRATLSGIASGKRPDYEALRRARGQQDEPLGPIERCPTCGGKVHMPCRLCRLRALRENERTVLRKRRHAARQLALRRLLLAVRKQSREREALRHRRRDLAS